MSFKPPQLQAKEEWANILTHALGIMLSLIASPILINMGLQTNRSLLVFGLSIYCFSLLMVYTSSTIYHTLRKPSHKLIFKKIDHISIYLLIGGTHTPFVLMFQNDRFGHYYLLTLWGLIVIGILYKLFFIGRFKRLSLFFYLFLGWMAVFIIPYMLENMGWTCFYWIIGGGAFYSLGAIFYRWEKLAYNHAIWHIFVLAGSAGHYIALCYAVG